MPPLLSILRAAHCRSTHHYFAIDSLRLVQTQSGLRLRGILLKYHEKYLIGTKDPDTRFRDFQNHVIHVQDGYFGGAPRLAMRWYDRLMGHLVASRWEDAAYAMGVLSHYFTDPLMPLHTAQSERETLVHRPMEWSVCKSYDRILKRWTDDEFRLVFQLGDGEGWLGEAILKGARFANRSYERLVENYDVDLGAENPAAGLDQDALDTFAELFGLSITGLARIVERAACEAESRCGVPLPKVGLTIPALLAVLQIPEQLWLRRITNREEREAIQAIITEYRVTGKVIRNMPQEVYIKQEVMRVREQEAAWNATRRERVLARGAQEAQIGVQPGAETIASMGAETIASTGEVTTLESIAMNSRPLQTNAPELLAQAPGEANADSDERVSVPFAEATRPRQTLEHAQGTSVAGKTGRIGRTDDLVDAPSIGPETAAAFAAIKIFKIGEFLDTPAAALSRRLQKAWITPSVIEDWQTQTLLMSEVPNLLCRDVQMLVGVGCNSVDRLATSDAKKLAAIMNRHALTSEGRKVLRGASPADAEQVARWIKDAGSVQRTRKAA